MSNYFVHESSFIDDNVKIGKGTKIWHFSHIQKNAIIGENCTIGQNVNISEGVVVGNGVKIQNNVSVYAGVELHDNVFCGPSCVFTNDINPRSNYPKEKKDYLRTIVEEGAVIGANATIICGTNIGRWAMVGAGAVVTKDVKAYSLVIGNPAIHNGWICECGLHLNESLFCSQCGRNFQEENSGLFEVLI